MRFLGLLSLLLAVSVHAQQSSRTSSTFVRTLGDLVRPTNQADLLCRNPTCPCDWTICLASCGPQTCYNPKTETCVGGKCCPSENVSRDLKNGRKTCCNDQKTCTTEKECVSKGWGNVCLDSGCCYWLL